MQIARPLRHPQPRPPVVAPGAGRIAIGAGMFVLIAAGWFGLQTWRVDRSPLPGAYGRHGACAVWFVGSSSMARWSTLDRDMAPWSAQNRGIGGARMSYVVRRFGNERGAPAPGAIVVYGGENDIAEGASVAAVVGDFRRLLAIKTREYGALPVIVLSLKPSPTRWRDLPEQTAFNRAIRRIAQDRRDLTYVDVVPEMLVAGRPGPFYRDDGVHMNAAGYALWTRVVRRTLDIALPGSVVRRCATRGA